MNRIAYVVQMVQAYQYYLCDMRSDLMYPTCALLERTTPFSPEHPVGIRE